jgi:hypothetical protein
MMFSSDASLFHSVVIFSNWIAVVNYPVNDDIDGLAAPLFPS